MPDNAAHRKKTKASALAKERSKGHSGPKVPLTATLAPNEISEYVKVSKRSTMSFEMVDSKDPAKLVSAPTRVW